MSRYKLFQLNLALNLTKFGNTIFVRDVKWFVDTPLRFIHLGKICKHVINVMVLLLDF